MHRYDFNRHIREKEKSHKYHEYSAITPWKQYRTLSTPDFFCPFFCHTLNLLNKWLIRDFIASVFAIFMQNCRLHQWYHKNVFLNNVSTLKVPRFFTEHAIRTFLPAGTVTFSIISVNSGSSDTAMIWKKWRKKWSI